MIPDGRDAAEASDEKEDADEDVPGLSAVSAKGAPVGCGVKGPARQSEKDYTKADADRGEDVSGHIGAPVRCKAEGVRATKVFTRVPRGFGADPGIILPSNFAVGLLVAAHGVAWLMAKT